MNRIDRKSIFILWVLLTGAFGNSALGATYSIPHSGITDHADDAVSGSIAWCFSAYGAPYLQADDLLGAGDLWNQWRAPLAAKRHPDLRSHRDWEYHRLCLVAWADVYAEFGSITNHFPPPDEEQGFIPLRIESD